MTSLPPLPADPAQAGQPPCAQARGRRTALWLLAALVPLSVLSLMIGAAGIGVATLLTDPQAALPEIEMVVSAKRPATGLLSAIYDAATIDAFRALLNRAMVATPNLPELDALGGEEAVLAHGCSLLVKGGHGAGAIDAGPRAVEPARDHGGRERPWQGT